MTTRQFRARQLRNRRGDRIDAGMSAYVLCAGFRTPAITGPSTRACSRRSKSAKDEIAAGGSAAAVPQALWGFGHGRELEAGRFARAVRVEREYNLNVTARILLNGEFTFCPIHDFNELRVARERDRQLLRDELPDNVWMSDSIAIDLDFESLDRPSWTVFDLLVNTIIVLSL